MRRFLIVAAMLIITAAAWRISERLSADALAMGTGLMFGVLAGVPMALLVLFSRRLGDGRRDEYEDEDEDDDPRARVYGRRAQALPHFGQQPPVIVLAGPQYGAQPHQAMVDGWGRQPSLPSLPGPQVIDGSSRSFKVVGEQEEWIEEF